jgi:tellurite resistance protein TehA-like permease
MYGIYTSMIFGILLCFTFSIIMFLIIRKRTITIGGNNLYLYPMILIFLALLIYFSTSQIIDIKQKLLFIEIEQFLIIISIIFLLTTYKKEELQFEILPPKTAWRRK